MDDLADTDMPAVGASRMLQRQATREAMVKHTMTGVSYVSFTDKQQEDTARLPLMATLADIEHRYGAGNRLYFNLLLFAVFTNGVLLIPGIVEWSFYLADPLRVPRRGPFEWKDFFVSEYLRPEAKAWFWCSTVMAILFPLLACLYYVWERNFFHLRNKNTVYDAAIFNTSVNTIEENLHLPRGYVLGMRVVVALVVVASVAAATGILYGVIVAENFLIIRAIQGRTVLTRATLSTVLSIISGIILVVLGAIWMPISRWLTRLEKHQVSCCLIIDNFLSRTIVRRFCFIESARRSS
jgi:hypothetical protein